MANTLPTWTKDFPVIGQGVFIFNIQRQSEFSIHISQKLDTNASGADEWISLTISKDAAVFKMNGELHKGELITADTANAGYEPDDKIAYWFSYDRDFLVLKYGKGYIMEETTLMTFDFLKSSLYENFSPKDKKHKEAEFRECLQYLFSSTIRRKIEVKDNIGMIHETIKRDGYKGTQLPDLFPNFDAGELEAKSMELAKSLIDIEGQVDFDKAPFRYNWSPFILDSSEANLFDLDSAHYTFSSSLPPACLELYSTVTAPNVHLDWSRPGLGVQSRFPLSNAIRHSIVTDRAILNEKLKQKAAKYGSAKKAFLCVTLGENHGNSMFGPYVLEIWPAKHGSPIHNHGNSFAVIKVVHGGLTIRIYNKHVDDVEDKVLQTIDVKKGDCTWISPNWFQTHELWNHSDDYCATIQCYKYGENDVTHWPYFDYVASTDVIKGARGGVDYTFLEMQEKVIEEYERYMKEEKAKPRDPKNPTK